MKAGVNSEGVLCSENGESTEREDVIGGGRDESEH